VTSILVHAQGTDFPLQLKELQIIDLKERVPIFTGIRKFCELQKNLLSRKIRVMLDDMHDTKVWGNYICFCHGKSVPSP
jgi:hypothetical protein